MTHDSRVSCSFKVAADIIESETSLKMANVKKTRLATVDPEMCSDWQELNKKEMGECVKFLKISYLSWTNK